MSRSKALDRSAGGPHHWYGQHAEITNFTPNTGDVFEAWDTGFMFRCFHFGDGWVATGQRLPNPPGQKGWASLGLTQYESF